MKYSLKTNLLALLAGVGLLIASGYAFVFWNNLTLLEDPHNVVESARLTGGTHTQDMTRLLWGTHVVNTGVEGSIEVTCHDGTVATGGYVTRNFGQTYSITRDCQLEWVP